MRSLALDIAGADANLTAAAAIRQAARITADPVTPQHDFLGLRMASAGLPLPISYVQQRSLLATDVVRLHVTPPTGR